MIDIKRIKRIQSREWNCSHIENPRQHIKMLRAPTRSDEITFTIDQLRNAPAVDKLSILDGVFEKLIGQCYEFTNYIGEYGELVATLILSGELDLDAPEVIEEFQQFTSDVPYDYLLRFFQDLSSLCDRVKPTYFKIYNGITRLNYFQFSINMLENGYNLVLNTGETLGMMRDNILAFNNTVFQTVTKAITTAVNGLQAIRDVNTLFSNGRIPSVADIGSILGRKAQSLANDVHELFVSISSVLSRVSNSAQVVINNYLNVVLDWFTNLYTTLRDSVTEDLLGIQFSDPTWKFNYSISIPWGTIVSTVGTLTGAIVSCIWPVVGFAIQAVTNIIPGIADFISQKVDDTTMCGISNVNFDAYGYNVPYHQEVLTINDAVTGSAFSWFDSILKSRSVNYAKLTTQGRIHYFWYSNSDHQSIKVETYADMTFNPVLALWFAIYDDALNNDITDFTTNWIKYLFGDNYDPQSVVNQEGKCTLYDIIDDQFSHSRVNEWLSDRTKGMIQHLVYWMYDYVEFPDYNLPNFDPDIQGIEICKHWYTLACCNRRITYKSFTGLLNKWYQEFVVTGDQLQRLHEIYDEYDGIVPSAYDSLIRKDWCVSLLPINLFYNWNNIYPSFDPTDEENDDIVLLQFTDNDTLHSNPDTLHNSLYEKFTFEQAWTTNNTPAIGSSGWVQFTIDSPHNVDGVSPILEGLLILDAWISNIIAIKFATSECRGVLDDCTLTPAGFWYIANSAYDMIGTTLSDYNGFRNSHSLDSTPGSSQYYIANQLNYYPILNTFGLNIPNLSVKGDFINIVSYTDHNISSHSIFLYGPSWSSHTGTQNCSLTWLGDLSVQIGRSWTNIYEEHCYQYLDTTGFLTWNVLCNPEEGLWKPIPLGQEEASIEHSGFISFMFCGKGDQYYTLPRVSIKAWLKLAFYAGLIAAAITAVAIVGAVVKRKINRAAQKCSLQTDILGFSDDLLSSDKETRNAAFKKYRRSALKTSILQSLCGSSIEADESNQSVILNGTDLTPVNEKLDYITSILNDTVNKF